MNTKKPVRFFNWSPHHDGGFTLVELIVVIAILAILAAVAVPAYSGYIEKAERAADEQLLAAINTAYASACLENGTDMALLATITKETKEGPSMPLEGDKGNQVVNLNGVKPYGDAFARYYAGNEASAFKVFDSIVYSPSLGMFCDSATAPDMLVGGYLVDGAALNAFKNSALGEVGAAGLLDMMTNLSGELGDSFGKKALADALDSKAYQDAALALLGVTDMTYDVYMQAKEDALYEQYLEEYYKNNPDAPVRGSEAQAIKDKLREDAKKQREETEKNMLILVGASGAENVDNDEFLALMQSGDAYTEINGNVKGNDTSAEGTAQSALAYSLYASYCQRNNKEVDPGAFSAALAGMDEGFNEYLKSPKAKTDLEGAKGALSIVGDQDTGTLESTAVNGLGNQELEDALTQILGK